MPNGVDLKFDLPTDAELKAQFDFVPKLEYYKVTDKVTDAGAAPILARAIQLTPRGDVTGTSAKRSKKQAASARWSIPLWKTIKKVTRKYYAAGVSIIGPEWPTGNKAYFNTSVKGRRQVLWGRRTGRVVAQIRNWIVQAFDETRAQQLAAMKAKLTELIDKMMKAK